MEYCHGTTDKAFSHLTTGIHTLYVSGNRITDQAFSHWLVFTLHLSICNQITDGAFIYLTGIHTLIMSGCTQITDQAFSHLVDILVVILNTGCSKQTGARINLT